MDVNDMDAKKLTYEQRLEEYGFMRCIDDIRSGLSQREIGIALGGIAPAHISKFMHSTFERSAATREIIENKKKKRNKPKSQKVVNPSVVRLEEFGINRICQLRESAKSQAEIASMADVDDSVMMAWIKSDAEREAQYMRSSQQSMESWLDRGLFELMSSPRDNPLELNRARAIDAHCARRADIIKSSLASYKDRLSKSAGITVMISADGKSEENL
jgi:hypothetical protein